MSQHPLVEALREFAPYLHAHHGRTFVLCIPGEALLDEDRRALTASAFGAALEMAREGQVSVRQSAPFAPLYIKGRSDG